ncbi:MAG: hypothetical protein BM556_16870 [Bacteriovorax sp. MedPE-SWde]|nr:MAG: hypothetical protein BM556_16870 [Bacteriovorax sp. MedPE-SWde]
MSNEIYDIANGFGFTFAQADECHDVSPEMFLSLIINEYGIKLIKREARLHSLVRTWIKTNARFLRTDALKKISLTFESVELSILASFCAIARENDSSSRWDKLIDFLRKRIVESTASLVPESYPEERMDSYLLEFGIRTRSISFQDLRKFKGRDWLIQNSPWIRNRLIMTVSARADMATYLGLYSDPTEESVCSQIFIGRSSYFSLKEDVSVINDFLPSYDCA